MLIMHEVGLRHGLRGDGGECGAALLDVRRDQVNGFHLADAEWAPASADETEDERAVREQIGGADEFAIVML